MVSHQLQGQRDGKRIQRQLEAVKDIMLDGDWHSLGELRAQLLERGVVTNEASIGARVRDLRKTRFGGYSVLRKYLGGGLWVYRLGLSA